MYAVRLGYVIIVVRCWDQLRHCRLQDHDGGASFFLGKKAEGNTRFPPWHMSVCNGAPTRPVGGGGVARRFSVLGSLGMAPTQ